MSGKAYTMKEMKAIVDYLTERRAYGEIKGRKMWTDFEKSKFTDRTWQSLKETFLKRILPDIHNPYYQLSLVQITSFRQGYDVEAKLNNKLEIRTVGEGSSSDAAQPENPDQPSTSNTKDGENASGEEIINSKTISHHRASAETVILDPCYETVEEIQRDLESPKQCVENPREKDSNKSPPKTLRDFITYSEPLTPMLQEVIDDFATDEERDISDDEPKMEIAEDVENDKAVKNSKEKEINEPIEINSDSDDHTKSNVDKEKHIQAGDSNQDDKNDINENEKPLKNSEKPTDKILAQKTTAIEDCQKWSGDSEMNNKKNKDSNDVASSPKGDTILESNAQDKPEGINPSNGGKVTFSQDTCTQNFSNTTTDTLIPNNQEALGAKSNPTDNIGTKEMDLDNINKNQKKPSRKRANSQEPTSSKQKRRPLVPSSKSISISDTDASNKQCYKLNTKMKMSVSANHNKKTSIEIKDNLNKIENHTKQNPKESENALVEEIKENVDEAMKVNTNSQTDKKDETVTCDEDKNVIDSDIENPCLKSVSLYDEQFTSIKYSDSSDDISAKKPHGQKEMNAQKKKKAENEAVLLKSNSESENREAVKKKKTTSASNLRSERDSALAMYANVFGFASGAAPPNSRKRRVRYQNRTRRQSQNKASSGSSEWTSETEAEFVSPPRGRRNKHAKKYQKPRPARILSLEEEGGLFVMYGKKIYPVVKDGKIMKNYVTYAPERDSEDEEESFWKLKYIEEKKRTAQLTKLLHQNTNDDHHSLEGSASFDQNLSPKKRKILKTETETQEKNIVQEVAPKEHVEPPKSITNEKTLKIKITKQNEEVQLEGHWSQIHPVLDQVVQIFHKEIEPKSYVTPSPQMETLKISSRVSTPVTVLPVDQEVRDKVNKLETEIFQEIEALDKQERDSPPKSPPPEEPKVTKKRLGRPRKSATTTSVPESPEKKQSKGEAEKLLVQENLQKLPPNETENSTSPVTRKTRTPKKVLRESTGRNESNVINTRTKRTKELPPSEQVDDETVRYKFPSPPPSARKTYRRSGANKNAKEQKAKNRYMKKTLAIFSSPDNISINSIESSQGYQDSDISPTINLRKKKKLTTTSNSRGKYNNRTYLRRRTHWWLDDMSDQSSNSCPDFSRSNSIFGPKSTSDIYRSESYQFLMPKIKNSFNPLAKIDEANANDQTEIVPGDGNGIDVLGVGNSDSNASNIQRTYKEQPDGVNGATDVDNSSNVSLPPSPVLSIVENISISNNALNSFHNDLNNENVNKYLNEGRNNNDYKITDVDVSMPLMQQDGCLKTNLRSVTKQKYDLNNVPSVITESFLNKICTVNIEDNPTLSETINQKLRDLLLESAKKLARKSQVTEAESSNKMDIDSVQIEIADKTKSKKRCSTPLKRRNTRKKSKRPEIEPFIEEEHTESCSQSGRKSCPPVIQIPIAGLYSEAEKENLTGDATLNHKKSRKRKENVIKVKILRPRVRNCSKETEIKNICQKGSEGSVHGDSGINDTISSVLLQGEDDSVDLIHNHSETCLKANDCVGDSVEFIENCTNSVITLDTSSDQSVAIERECQINCGLSEDSQIGMYNGCGRGETFFQNAIEMTRNKRMDDNELTAYHTPMNSVHSPTSLITEDLSDPELEAVEDRTSRSSKWYLFSEDETTSNAFPINNNNNNVRYGADLNLLFPVTCAIPDLSTITEMSNDKAPGSERGTIND